MTCNQSGCESPRHVDGAGRVHARCHAHVRAYALERYYANPEQSRSYTRRWRENNKERRATYGRAWRAANADHLREQSKAWHRANRGKLRDLRRAALYGVPVDWFRDQLVGQAGRCAICTEVFPSARDTHVDHDHATGRVRGLLCSGCNSVIGMAQDSVPRLTAAVRYLQAAS